VQGWKVAEDTFLTSLAESLMVKLLAIASHERLLRDHPSFQLLELGVLIFQRAKLCRKVPGGQ
jgi:hypothetical protein